MVKIKYIIVGMLMLSLMCICSGCSEKKESDKEDKIATDIEIKNNEINFSVNRNFYLYTDNPADVKNTKPEKEVKVIISGKGNIDTNKYEGDVSVEGLELGGDLQGYTLSKTDQGYNLVCMGGNSKNTEQVEGKLYTYQIDMTEKFDDISIWVIGMDENKPEEWYWVREKGE